MFPRFIIPLATVLLGQAAATCYFPDGNISPADVACNAEASDSFCCFSKQACLSNKICLTGVVDDVNQYARGTCTDQTWQSGACPNFCPDQQALGNVMYSCNVTGVDSYCCNNDCSCDPSVGDEVVSFTGTPYTISVIGVTGTTYPNPSATASAATTTSSSSSAEVTSSSSSSSSSLSSSASSTGYLASNTAASAATIFASTTPPASGKSSSNSVAIGAGVGVGVGVGILLLGAGAFFFYRQGAKSRTNTEPNTDKPAPGYSEQPGYPTSPNQYTDHMAKQQYPMSSNVSELSSAGHEYNELGTDRTRMAQSARRSDIPELPGQQGLGF